MVLEAKRVVKATVPSSLIPCPSPGNLQPTRLALRVDDHDSKGRSCWAFVASGYHVYKLLVSLEETSLDKGKESLLIPTKTQVLEGVSLSRCPHRSEIQSIALAEMAGTDYLMLGSVDSCGHLIVSKQDLSGEDIDSTYSVLPPDSGVGEGSWAGLCFSPYESSMAVVARSFCRSIDVYDQDTLLRTLKTLWYPSSLNFVETLSNGSTNSILAITEGSQLTIYDLRMKENGGCLHRICGTCGDIFYAVCSSTAGYIAVGGDDRTVTVYDPRRWSALSRWVHCSKYEVRFYVKRELDALRMVTITGLAFSSVNRDCIYIQGLDYEVICGNWRESQKIFSFRGDSNWLGFSKCPGKDVLGGWCDSGSIFIADFIAC